MNNNLNKSEYSMSNTKDELLSICADRGIKNCKSKNKPELIKLIDASKHTSKTKKELILNMPKYGKMKLFLKLSNYDEESGISQCVSTSSFTDEYLSLKLGNGGGWCRKNACKNLKIATCKQNGKIEYLWKNANDEEKTEIQDFFDVIYPIDTRISGNSIKYIKVFGKNDDSKQCSRSIRKNIKDYWKKHPCCVCGSNTDIECDHKNGLYNDERVNNIETQLIEDFQSLCKHCNDQKRQVEKKTRETGKRYGASNIPSLKIFNIDFTCGDENYDPKDPNALVGTYWYDPIAFNEYVVNLLFTKLKMNNNNI